jgi:phenylalanyl-tRNA synthetase beta chain
MHPKNTKNNVIFAEILTDQNIEHDYKFQEYDNSPLKERDITIPLKKNESIQNSIIEFKKIEGIFEIKKIDSFIKEEINYVTFKIKMNNASLIEFDKKFNI